MIHIIIGCGAAAITAAKTIRELDENASIIMIFADEHLHSRCMLHQYLRYNRDEETISVVPSNFFETQNITWLKKTFVTHIDTSNQEVILHDRTKLYYDRLLIATGAYSFIPPIGQFREATNVFGLRNLTDAQQITKLSKTAEHVLIVGSGLVSMDVAYALLEQEKDVTVVEMEHFILPKQLDSNASHTYQQLFEQHGCKFYLGRKVLNSNITKGGKITSVTLDDGITIPCDFIIVAAGICPSIDCVSQSNIETERYIKVDDTLKTSVSNVYAAGDVIGLSAIWPNTMKQGQIAAYNMCGFTTQYIDSYTMKNTMNFYGLSTLSFGDGHIDDNDEVILYEDVFQYKKAILHNGSLKSILLQGNIDYSGIYQYLIKNKIDISKMKANIFKLSFADFYGIEVDGRHLSLS